MKDGAHATVPRASKPRDMLYWGIACRSCQSARRNWRVPTDATCMHPSTADRQWLGSTLLARPIERRDHRSSSHISYILDFRTAWPNRLTPQGVWRFLCAPGGRGLRAGWQREATASKATPAAKRRGHATRAQFEREENAATAVNLWLNQTLTLFPQ